ncbi:MAG: hypothetical protein WCT49_01610 [Candidatus Paceibacterota bacterium]|jgi:hypothetical protein|nr:hypothetical protein [Candidatus Paceibacterota bacterium]
MNIIEKSKSYHRPHPECREDEVYVMNASKRFFAEMDWWETKRMGQIPYSRNGMTHEQNKVFVKFFPVFVSKKEVERKGYVPIVYATYEEGVMG